MIPKPLHAVVFDMDGLLLDTEALYRIAIFAACEAQGQQMVDDVHLSLIGTPRESGDSKLTEYFGRSFDLQRYHRDCGEHFDDLCHTSIPLRPGAASLLGALREASIPMAVATSTANPTAVRHLTKAGIVQNFEVIVTRSDVRTGKPSPETFLKAAALLRVDPGNCLALEDSYSGVRAAAAAGMSTIMIPDFLPPIPEITELCVGVLPSLEDVQVRIAEDL